MTNQEPNVVPITAIEQPTRRAGGFTGLQAAGWNRATIFRKLRRFRSTFGTHPDDYQPDWIQLDLPCVWAAVLRRRLAAGDEPELTDATVA